MDTMTGIELIAAERKRQIAEEGFAAEHDDQGSKGEFVKAAICYLYPGDENITKWKRIFWPWDDKWWKPTPGNRIRDLEKAGALVAAEIDRLQRKDDET
jgi:hypothetical protein